MTKGASSAAPAWHRVDHPLAQHKLTYLRDVQCSISRFRQLTKEIGILLAIEIMRDWQTIPAEVITPNDPEKMVTGSVLGEKIVIAPILRAGLVLAEGALEVIPNALVGHIGLGRSPGNYNKVIEYITSIPEVDDQLFILMDSVIGTGETAYRAVRILREAGVRADRIRFGTILVTAPGLTRLKNEFDNVPVFALEMEELDEKTKHILPGLGDTANRLFGV